MNEEWSGSLLDVSRFQVRWKTLKPWHEFIYPENSLLFRKIKVTSWNLSSLRG